LLRASPDQPFGGGAFWATLAVLLSYEAFQALKPLVDLLEDRYWGIEAEKVKA
jgi:hypothetical protein